MLGREEVDGAGEFGIDVRVAERRWGSSFTWWMYLTRVSGSLGRMDMLEWAAGYGDSA